MTRKAIGNISLTTLDEFLDWAANENGTDHTPGAIYRNLAWIYGGIDIVSNATARMPFAIYRGNEIATQSGREYEDVTGSLPEPTDVLKFTAASLQLLGQAYLSKDVTNSIVPGLRPLIASSIHFKGVSGETVHFKRDTETGKQLDLTQDELIYLWLLDPGVEFGPPKAFPVRAALGAAGVLLELNSFAAGYFASGATKRTILAVPGGVRPEERDRLKAWWVRLKSWATEVINADSIKATVVGEGLSELTNNDLSTDKRAAIAFALGVPMSMMDSASAGGLGGGGVMEGDRKLLYDNTVVPLGARIASILNAQYFTALGYRFAYLPDTLDVYQQEESDRSGAFSTYVGAGMRPDIAATMLGLEVPTDIDPAMTAAFESDEPEEEPIPDEEPEPEPEPSIEDDLKRWRRKALKRFDEGHIEKALSFDSTAIPSLLQAFISSSLSWVRTTADIEYIFNPQENVKSLDAYIKAIDSEGPPRAADELELQAQLQAIFDQYDQDALPYVRGESEEQPDYDALRAALLATLLTFYTRLAERNAMDAAADTGVYVDQDALQAGIEDWADARADETVNELMGSTRRFIDRARRKYEPGMTDDQTQELLRGAFGETRAQTISISEVSRGLTAGVLTLAALYAALGLETVVIWNTSQDELVCPICGPLNGKGPEIWAQEFPGGPGTAHPRCRCFSTVRVRRKQ
ncbi:MAG: phage portal protein [FCB group bacterium]|nr:phage portal protein [FCB group bacterium]